MPWSPAIPHDDGMLEIEGDSGVRAAARALAIINGTERGGGFSHTLLEAATRKVDESAQDRAYFNRVLSLALRSAWGHPERARSLPAGGDHMELADAATTDAERVAFRPTRRTFRGRGGR